MKTWSSYTFEYKGMHDYKKEDATKSFKIINHKNKDISPTNMVWISMQIGTVKLVDRAEYWNQKYK